MEGDAGEDDSELGVFLLVDGKATWTVVETGIQDSRFVAIKGDVAEDATLVSGPYDVVSRTLNHSDDVEPK